MRRRPVVVGLLAALVVSLVAAAPAVAAPRQASGGYIVVLDGSANPTVMAGGTGPGSGTCTGMR
jgi:hypothetical protein